MAALGRWTCPTRLPASPRECLWIGIEMNMEFSAYNLSCVSFQQTRGFSRFRALHNLQVSLQVVRLWLLQNPSQTPRDSTCRKQSPNTTPQAWATFILRLRLSLTLRITLFPESVSLAVLVFEVLSLSVLHYCSMTTTRGQQGSAVYAVSTACLLAS